MKRLFRDTDHETFTKPDRIRGHDEGILLKEDWTEKLNL